MNWKDIPLLPEMVWVGSMIIAAGIAIGGVTTVVFFYWRWAHLVWSFWNSVFK